MTKFSIITSVFNSIETIDYALNSVAAQKYDDYEHIIIDGGSTDGSLRQIRNFQNSKLKIISESDDGIYDALNKGIKLASGDIIGFVHSDDFYAHTEVLSRIARVFEDPSVEAVYADLEYVSKKDTARIIRIWCNGEYSKNKLRYGWMPAHPTLFLRKTVYDRYGMFDTKYSISADYDFILRYFSQSSGKKVYLADSIYKMRVGGESNKNILKIIKKMHEDYRAIRKNRVGNIFTLVCKNLTKIKQFNFG